MTPALLLVDLQNDFCLNGSLAVNDADSIIPLANQLMQQFKLQQWKVIATLDWHPQNHQSFASNAGVAVGHVGELDGLTQVFWPDHCVQGSSGAQLHADLNTHLIDKKIVKGQMAEVDSYSAFFDNARRSKTELDDYLKQQQIDCLFILGLATDYCVKFSALDGLELGYQVYVVRDGCRGVELAAGDSQRALAQICQSGGHLIDVEQVAALLSHA